MDKILRRSVKKYGVLLVAVLIVVCSTCMYFVDKEPELKPDQIVNMAEVPDKMPIFYDASRDGNMYNLKNRNDDVAGYFNLINANVKIGVADGVYTDVGYGRVISNAEIQYHRDEHVTDYDSLKAKFRRDLSVYMIATKLKDLLRNESADVSLYDILKAICKSEGEYTFHLYLENLEEFEINGKNWWEQHLKPDDSEFYWVNGRGRIAEGYFADKNKDTHSISINLRYQELHYIHFTQADYSEFSDRIQEEDIEGYPILVVQYFIDDEPVTLQEIKRIYVEKTGKML